jgi:L-aminopeptidase/D-esterase-like protein
VVLWPQGAVAGGSVRGLAPGTRETALLRPGTLVEQVHAVLLTGGSAFGLAAADGVMRYLAERGCGYDAGVARVPIVPGAVLFDLAVGRADVRPDAPMGYAACLAPPPAAAAGQVGAAPAPL